MPSQRPEIPTSVLRDDSSFSRAFQSFGHSLAARRLTEDEDVWQMNTKNSWREWGTGSLVSPLQTPSSSESLVPENIMVSTDRGLYLEAERKFTYHRLEDDEWNHFEKLDKNLKSKINFNSKMIPNSHKYFPPTSREVVATGRTKQELEWNQKLLKQKSHNHISMG